VRKEEPMTTGIDPKVDYVFKRLFGTVRTQALTVHLLNAALRLPPAHRVADLELLNPFADKETLDDKLSVLEVKARDQAGRLFNVEMQMLAHRKFFPRRLLYYWA
jgi:predicted transposase/invertase (TIGR01784 family)